MRENKRRGPPIRGRRANRRNLKLEIRVRELEAELAALRSRWPRRATSDLLGYQLGYRRLLWEVLIRMVKPSQQPKAPYIQYDPEPRV